MSSKKWLLGVAVITLSLVGGAGTAPAKGEQATLTVQLVGLRSSSGVVLVGLFASPEGFPTKPAKAISGGRGLIRNGRAVVTLRSLSPGTYAVSAFHDENGDGKLETNWLGIPKEGTAASNNAKGTFGPPSFKAASFRIHAGTSGQTIRMSYL